MNQINLKTHYTAQELADMRLHRLPETRRNCGGAKTNSGILVLNLAEVVVTNIR